MIEWHKETWYSNLGTFVFLAIGLPILFFYIGLRFISISKPDDWTESNAIRALQTQPVNSTIATSTASTTSPN